MTPGYLAMRILVTVLVSLSWSALARADLYSDCAQRSDLELAIRACTQIIEEDGRQSSARRSIAYKSRGDSYFANGDYERAVSDLGMAITLSPQDADAYIKRGMAHDAKNDFQHGIADFGMAISLRPGSATPYTMRGGAYERAGDKERAIADLQKALELDPCSLAGADLTGANVTGANFKDADVNSAKLLSLQGQETAIDFQKARNLEHALRD